MRGASQITLFERVVIKDRSRFSFFLSKTFVVLEYNELRDSVTRVAGG